MSEAGPTAEVTYRRAEEADLPRVFAVFRAALNAYLVPAGQEGIPEDDEQSPVYRHFLEHDGERFWVAEAVVEDLTGGGGGTLGAGGRQIVAWGSGLLRGDWWFLSSLFVLPEAQGRGVGGRLFELAATGAPPGAVRATVTDSLQPVSNTLYARRGLLPREVLVGFGGQPREGARRPAARHARAGAPHRRRDPRTARDRRGGERPRPERRPRVLPGRRRPVRLPVPPPRPPGRLRHAATGRLGRAGRVRTRERRRVPSRPTPSPSWPGADGIDKIRAGVAGRCEGAQRAFWQAGLVFDGTPGLLLSSRPFGRLDRYVVASYGMF